MARPAAGAPHRRACLQGRRGPRDAAVLRRGDHPRPLPPRPRCELRPRRRLALRRRRQGVLRKHRPPRHRRRQSDAARRRRPGEGVAGEQGSIAYQPALEKIAGFDINWNIVAFPGTAWAAQVFPGEDEAVAVAGSRTRSSPPRASTAPTRSVPGASIMRRSPAAPPGSTARPSRRCTSPGRAPT